MPMPHQVQMQLIKRRLVGKDGSARIKELRAILEDLPDYKNGPYADIRKWVMGQIDQTRVRSRVVHRDSLAVRREGVAQVALVGPPNVGKSSLLQALSDIQIKTGDYPFTTVRPVAALTRIRGLPVQLVEIPGLIAGATEDRGGGRALLGVLRGADAVVYCHDVTSSTEPLRRVRAEVAAAGIDLPALLAATKLDEADPAALERLRRALPELPVVGVSVLDDASLHAFRDAVWELTGLLRVFTRRPGSDERDPLAVRPEATVADVARALHGELGDACKGAHVWGASARFDGQRVGRDHRVAEDDLLEILA
ncbi:MAG: GTPase [Candidatus Velamenicoccus archaeovorus]